MLAGKVGKVKRQRCEVTRLDVAKKCMYDPGKRVSMANEFMWFFLLFPLLFFFGLGYIHICIRFHSSNAESEFSVGWLLFPIFRFPLITYPKIFPNLT